MVSRCTEEPTILAWVTFTTLLIQVSLVFIYYIIYMLFHKDSIRTGLNPLHYTLLYYTIHYYTITINSQVTLDTLTWQEQYTTKDSSPTSSKPSAASATTAHDPSCSTKNSNSANASKSPTAKNASPPSTTSSKDAKSANAITATDTSPNTPRSVCTLKRNTAKRWIPSRTMGIGSSSSPLPRRWRYSNG